MTAKFFLLGFLVAFLLAGCASRTQDKESVLDIPAKEAFKDAGAPSNDFADKGYSELAVLGVPLECNVKTEKNGVKLDMKLHIKGNKFTAESEAVSGIPSDMKCNKVITIYDGRSVFIGTSCTDVEIMPGCQWLQIDLTKFDGVDTSSTATGAVSPKYLEEVPAVDFKCEPALLEDETFAAPSNGKICDLTDLLKEVTSGSADSET